MFFQLLSVMCVLLVWLIFMFIIVTILIRLQMLHCKIRAYFSFSCLRY
jgi:hypothetical protein